MTTPSESDIKSLEHFLRLVRNGRRSGCSGGERAAYKLAQCVLDNAPGLDESAIDGLKTFISGCIEHPTTARELVGAR